MTVSVEMVIQSHLSDLIEMDGYFTTEERMIRLKFIKYLVHFHTLEEEIDPDEVFEAFLKQK
jgi:hypothetical protein